MKAWKTWGAHALGYILSALSIVAGLDPSVFGAHGLQIVGAAGLVLTFIHQLEHLDSAPAAVGKQGGFARVTMLAMLAFGVVMLLLQGCVTTLAQRSTLAAITDAAVIAVVQKGNPPAATETARAAKIKQIAVELQEVNKATAQSLPAVIQAVTPLIASAGLNPAETILAQQLVAALSAQLQAQLGANPKAAEVQTTVGVLLDDVIAACAAYGA